MQIHPCSPILLKRAFIQVTIAAFFHASCLAATFQVTNTADSGPGSLRQAIENAELRAGADTITFAPGFFANTPRVIELANVLPTISTEMTISGPGASLLSLLRPSSAAEFRIMDVAGNLHLSGVTITGGKSGAGSGINNGGTLTVVNSTFNDNIAEFWGGAIFSYNGTLTVSNSTFSNNTVTTGVGGGIYNLFSSLTVTNSTFNKNTANFGGGIFNDSGGGIITITNSTVSGNTATGFGGGVFNGGTLNAANCIFAGNTGSSSDFRGTLISQGYNLIGDGTDTEITGTLIGNQVGTGSNKINPKLGPLANNGGPTQTMALLNGSPAINAGPSTSLFATDQRGPGFSRIIGTASDIGAFEQEKFVSILANAASGNEGNSGTSNFDFTVFRIGGTAGPVDVTYTVSGVAVSAADFGGSFPTGTATIADGATSTTVTIPVSGDILVETNETFTVAISAPTNGYVVSGTGASSTATITDNDTATVSIVKINNGAETNTPEVALFRVTQTAQSSTATTINYSVSGTATSVSDFTALTGSVTITAGSTTADITATVLNENMVEPTETLTLTLSGFAAADSDITLGTTTAASANITDDDSSIIALAVVSADKSEGTNGTTTPFTFTATLSNPVQGGLTVAYTTNNGTALASSDYTDTDSTLTFTGTASESKTITVNVTPDGTNELDETFSVALGAVSGLPSGINTTRVTTAASPQTGTIRNDDALTMTIAATDADADENTSGTGTYRITRNSILGNTTVQLAIDSSSTASATDWTQAGAVFNSLAPSSAGTVVIPAGQTFVDINLTPTADIHAEAAETVHLNILSDAAYTTGSPANATVSIGQNDFVVINTNDAGEGSFRQAITNSNNLSGAETITFEGGIFTDASVPDIIDLGSRLPSLDFQSTLAGPGADKLIIRRRALVSSFGLVQVSGKADVTLSGLTLSGGVGGIANLGKLRVDRCTISGNTESTYGGILNNGTLVVTHSTISGNNSSGGVGGGIYNLGGRTLSVYNSTISGNSSKNGGGGISIVSGSSVLIANSTVSGNTAGSSGAGVLNSGALTMVNSTITGNSGTGQGGGIATSIGSSLTLANSIVAGNTARTSPDIETYNPSNLISSNGANFIGSPTGAAGLKSTDQTFASTGKTLSQLLAPLANNGGTTQTHALVNGSPAINDGRNSDIPADAYDFDADSNTTEPLPNDQRGLGFARIVGSSVDIGAFEAFAFEPTVTTTITNEDTLSTSGLVIMANPADDGLTAHYKISNILNGTLYLNDGITSISSGSFITKAQAAAGLRFLPAANLHSLNTASFGFSVQAAVNTADEGLRGFIQSGVITVHSINDIPTVVTPGLADQSIKIGDILSIPLSGIFADVDLDSLIYTISNNSISTKASAVINGTNVNLTALANGVTDITVQANDGNMGSVTDTFEVAVGTRYPTPVQVGTTAALISQNGLYQLTVNVINTTPRAINGFRLHVDYSSYLAAHPSLRLYNASSPAGSSDVYVDHLYPVSVDSTVPVKLNFYTSNRRFPTAFAPVISVEILTSSAVSDTNGNGVQPRVVAMTGGNLLLEFPSIPERWYRVRYSSDLKNWFDCPVPIQAVANRTQWIDSGAPFTPVPPSQAPSRYYLVNEIIDR